MEGVVLLIVAGVVLMGLLVFVAGRGNRTPTRSRHRRGADAGLGFWAADGSSGSDASGSDTGGWGGGDGGGSFGGDGGGGGGGGGGC